MKRLFAIPIVISTMLLSGCSRHSDGPARAEAEEPRTDKPPGGVSIPQDSPKLRRLQIQAVELQDVPLAEVTSPGKIELNPNRVSHISLPVAGRVATVSVRIGQAVRQGDPILTIESPDVDMAISSRLQAEAGITQAAAAAAKAQADVDRVRDLFEHNAVPKKDLLNADAQLVQANAALEQARAAASQARRRLEILGVKEGQFGQRMVVHAPLSGKVLDLNVVPGEFRNDTGAPVMTIADLATVWVTADVPETTIRHIRIGETLTVELSAYPNETFRARVTQIADTVDPQTRSVKVRAELANPSGRLRPEMFGRIRHVEGTSREPVVPFAAVLEDGGRQYVWKETRPGTFERAAIETGSRVSGQVAVKSGVSAGDRVVVDGVMLLNASAGLKQ